MRRVQPPRPSLLRPAAFCFFFVVVFMYVLVAFRTTTIDTPLVTDDGEDALIRSADLIDKIRHPLRAGRSVGVGLPDNNGAEHGVSKGGREEKSQDTQVAGKVTGAVPPNRRRALLYTMDCLRQYETRSKAGGPSGEIVVRARCVAHGAVPTAVLSCPPVVTCCSLTEGLAELGFKVDVARNDDEFYDLGDNVNSYALVFVDQWTAVDSCALPCNRCTWCRCAPTPFPHPLLGSCSILPAAVPPGQGTQGVRA